MQGSARSEPKRKDPALTDRTVTHLVNIDEASLPSRNMTIAGIEGPINARILSTDMRGATTRLVRMSAGWGTVQAGAFTADVEVFVVTGAIHVGAHPLRPCDYAAFRQGRTLPGLRAFSDTTALLMSSAPPRYATDNPQAVDIHIGKPSAHEWQAIPELPGRHLKHLGPGPAGDVWIEWAEGWDHHDGPWHRHPHHEECFVVAGRLSLRERQEGDAAEEAHAGHYFFRPANTAHTGPGSHCGDPAITFHRAFGNLQTDWLQTDPAG